MTKERSEILINSIFLAQRFEYIINHYLKDKGLTSKQLIVLAHITRQNTAPSLASIARELRMSYQNVKQIALALKQKGFLTMAKDSKNKRSFKLEVTEESKLYWSERDEFDDTLIALLFDPLKESEQKTFHSALHKLLDHNNHLYDQIKETQ